VYTVARGDTLTGVGRRFGLGTRRIAELNNLDPEGGLRADLELTLPPGAHDGGADPYAQGAVTTRSAPVAVASADPAAAPRPHAPRRRPASRAAAPTGPRPGTPPPRPTPAPAAPPRSRGRRPSGPSPPPPPPPPQPGAAPPPAATAPVSVAPGAFPSTSEIA